MKGPDPDDTEVEENSEVESKGQGIETQIEEVGGSNIITHFRGLNTGFMSPCAHFGAPGPMGFRDYGTFAFQGSSHLSASTVVNVRGV